MLRSTLALLLATAPAWAEESIAILDAYAIAAVPGLPSGAAYMRIENRGGTPDRLLSVDSPVAESVDLHGHQESEGIMRMRPLEEPLEIPAGGSITLERGGTHVMFMGLEEPFADGERVPLTLTFETAGEVAVEVTVDLSRLTGDPAEGQGDGGDAAAGHEHGAEAEGGHAGHGG